MDVSKSLGIPRIHDERRCGPNRIGDGQGSRVGRHVARRRHQGVAFDLPPVLQHHAAPWRFQHPHGIAAHVVDASSRIARERLDEALLHVPAEQGARHEGVCKLSAALLQRF